MLSVVLAGCREADIAIPVTGTIAHEEVVARVNEIVTEILTISLQPPPPSLVWDYQLDLPSWVSEPQPPVSFERRLGPHRTRLQYLTFEAKPGSSLDMGRPRAQATVTTIVDVDTSTIDTARISVRSSEDGGRYNQQRQKAILERIAAAYQRADAWPLRPQDGSAEPHP